MQFNAVVATNVHAIELYRKLGFRDLGTVPGAFDHATLGRVGLDIMYLQLGVRTSREHSDESSTLKVAL